MIHRAPQATAALLVVLATGGRSLAGPLDPGTKLCLNVVKVPIKSESARKQSELAIEQKLIGALRKASFDVVESDQVSPVRKRVLEEAGGFIDNVTGRRDPSRFAAFRKSLAASLRDELGCQAQLFASVEAVRASFAGGTARWDGTEQEVSSAGRQVLSLLGGTYESGWVTALSLWLRVTDLEGEEVAFRSAGIETPIKLQATNEDVVPEDHWLRDQARIAAAIRSALGKGGAALRLRGTPTPRP